MSKGEVSELLKLTKKQKQVVFLLMGGEVIVNDERWFYVSDGFKQHRIDWRTWDILTKRHQLIRQQLGHPHNYVLTGNAKKLETEYNQYISKTQTQEQ